MDTTVAVRRAAIGASTATRLARSSSLAAAPVAALAAVTLAAATVLTVAHADEVPAGPAAATPGRFEPVLEGEGYDVFDASPSAAPPRRGFSWPGFGGGELAAKAPAGPTAGSQVAERDRDQSSDQAGDEADASGWFVDDAVSLTGWLFGHHGTSHEPEACPPVCMDDCDDCPTWTGQIDALMLWMGNIQSRPFYIDSLGGRPVLGNSDLMPPLSAAPRYAVIYNRDKCRSIEVNYFSIWGFDAARQAGPFVDEVGDGALEMNDLAGLNFDRIGAARAESSAHIQSFEINLRKLDWGAVRWITGFRWVEWGQDLLLLDAVVEGGDVIGGDALGVATLNNLYGWQWGADAMLWNNGGRLRVNGIAKAGVYYNHQALQRTAYDNFVDPPTTIAAAEDTVGFVGETSITGSWAITNWLSWRAGYTLFWLGGIATPANQLSSTVVDPAQIPRAEVSPYGSVFLHGVNTGLEARW
jgi:hypothetical protein